MITQIMPGQAALLQSLASPQNLPPMPPEHETLQPYDRLFEASGRQDTVDIKQGRYYNLKFDFFYEKVLESSRRASVVQGDAGRELSQDLYQRLEARFSFDLSGLSFLAQQAGRAAGIDEETFTSFIEAAKGLSRFDESGLRTFLSEVDNLFNAVERILGLGADGLDDLAAVIKGGVKNFFGEVKALSQQIDTRDAEATAQFRAGLGNLLQSAREPKSLSEQLDTRLRDAGVSENLRASIMKLAALIEHLEKRDPDKLATLADKLDNLIDRLSRLAESEVGKPDAGTEKPQEATPKVAAIQEYTRSVERVQIDVTQTMASLAFA